MTVLVGSEVIDVLHCYELLKGRLSKVKKKGEGSVRVRGVCTVSFLGGSYTCRIAPKQISISSNHVKVRHERDDECGTSDDGQGRASDGYLESFILLPNSAPHPSCCSC